MTLEYIAPRVSIDESDVGTRVIPAVSLARIGVVGTFSKGPVNSPQLISSLSQLVSIFGGYTSGLTGYLSILGAMAQGVNDFYVVRVGGASLDSAVLTLLDSESGNSVVLTAATPGTWGNEIYAAVADGTLESTFKLVITCGSQQETFDNLTLANVGDIASSFVTAAAADGAAAIPANLSSTPLADGDDGAETVDADYVGTVDGSGNRSGLKVLDTVSCALVICAQQYSTTIRNALLTHCANTEIEYGARMAVLNTASGVTPTAAVLETADIDSERGILAYPWLELTEQAGQFVAPDGVYAGLLSVLAANQSPSNKQLLGVNQMERFLAASEIKALTQARISPISLIYGRGFRVRNGVTLSTDSAWSQTNIRRQFDKLEMEIYNATQWAVSENNTASLRASLAAQIDNYLAAAKTEGEIYDFKPTICDDTNNTAETIEARKLNVNYRVRPTYAADYIDQQVTRLTGDE